MVEDRMCNISTTIPRDVYDFVDNLHWTERRSVASIVREAIRDWAVAHGYGRVEVQEHDAQ